jgi:pimeloyl-ACP methyl ester carboxylesterase
MTQTQILETDGASIAYDVHGPLPTTDGRPALLMVGQPMDASGFTALASHFPDRTVVTYDPRGAGRSTRSDGDVTSSPTVQAEDLHAVVRGLDAGPVEIFASSGGAVSALALVTAHPDDVVTLVAHEPPLVGVLPDADLARRATQAVSEVYATKGWGAGMAAFLAMTMWQGQFTEEFLAQQPPEPAQFGLPTEDDGSRDDPLLGDRSTAITDYRPDVEALTSAPTRIVLAVGEETGDTLTARTARETARLLGREAVVFPSHHGGFAAEDGPWPGRPKEFAVRLREVLDRA